MVGVVDSGLVEVAVAAVRTGLVFDVVAVITVVAAGVSVVTKVLGAVNVVDTVDVLRSARTVAVSFVFPLIIGLC